MRKAALKTLRKLEPATLAQRAGAVVAQLQDSRDEFLFVREEASVTLRNLEPAALAQHAGAVAAQLLDGDGSVRGEAAKTLGMLEPEVLACLLYTSPSPRDGLLSRMPSSA